MESLAERHLTFPSLSDTWLFQMSRKLCWKPPVHGEGKRRTNDAFLLLTSATVKGVSSGGAEEVARC